VYEVVEFIESDPRFTLTLVVLNEGDKGVKRSMGSDIGYRFLRWIDRKTMATGKSPFDRKLLRVASVPVLRVTPIQKKYSDYFAANDIESIRSHDVDILLRFGFRILRGDILKAATHGILSLHHGDTSSYRGGPPAFWEVVNREPVTAVTLQRLTEKLDAGNILHKVFLRTDLNSFYRNQAKLYWAGATCLCQQLQALATRGPENYFESALKKYVHEPLGEKVYKNPGNGQSMKAGLQWAWYNISRKLAGFFFQKQWSLQFSKGIEDDQLPDFSSFRQLAPPKGYSWADPFLIANGKQSHLFFEELKEGHPRAHISCIPVVNGHPKPEQKEVVLSGEHHLSYPFVFYFEGAYYMLPECAASGSLVLYKSHSLPGNWVACKTLLSGVYIYDPTLFLHNGTWYLFCTQKLRKEESSDACLHIYCSHHLLNEPFLPHPQNPIHTDVRKARPAGQLFWLNGALIRPVQIGAPNYGAGISFQRVDVLSPVDYHETTWQVVKPDWDKRILAMHSFNSVSDLSVSDIQRNQFRFF
jgi:folate-dependent phosphoribosylglycinamide formyltransferase PurN